MSFLAATVSASALFASIPAAAQQATPAPDAQAPEPDAAAADDGGEEIVVTGARERGSVPGDIQPEQVLRSADIRAYGVSSIAELITELAPQTGGGRGTEGGMPVVLLNGRRISNFREIRDVPPEAIERTEILPPEAAQQLGYRAEQRVVNIVLRQRFNAYTAEANGGGATGGARYTLKTDGNYLRIQRDKRLNVHLDYDAATAIYEADRDLLPSTVPSRPYAIGGNITPGSGLSVIDPALPVPVAGVPGDVTGRPAIGDFVGAYPSAFPAYRTLSPATQKVGANATYSRNIFDTIAASVNVNLEASRSDSELGLTGANFTIPGLSPYSPFVSDVVLNRYLVEAGARGRTVRGSTGHVGLAFNGDWGEWRWSVTANYDRTFSRTLTDAGLDTSGLATRIAAGDPAINPFAAFDPGLLGAYRQDLARSLSSVANIESVVNGPIFTLPAGKVRTSLKTGFERSDFTARAVRNGTTSLSQSNRNVGSTQARIDVPLTSRRTGFLAPIGNLSANLNYAADRASDFGKLETWGYGLNWSPAPKLTMLASVAHDQNAPTTAQLGNPLIVTPETRVFDFVTGQSVDVTRIDGGNPLLRQEAKRTTSLTLNYAPLANTPLNLNVEYTDTRIDDPIASLPGPTAAIEAAFPDRFTRDAGGRLLRFDNRPINFARSERRQLRSGVNLSLPFGGALKPEQQAAVRDFMRSEFRRRRPTAFAGPQGPQTTPTPDTQAGTPPPAAQPSSTPPPANAQPAPATEQPRGPGGGRFQGRGGGGGGGRFGGGGFGGRGGAGRGRIQLSLYHTWRLEDTILLRDGGPTLDLLNGDAIDNRGGRPQHLLELNAGITKGGYGLRLSGNWQSGTFVRGGTQSTPTDLQFSSLTTLTLRGFVDFSPRMKLVREHPWLVGTRVNVAVRNLFDTRLRVTDPTGATPVNYQPDLLDPTGRTITIGIRKLLF
jgi:uncharacterized membrane protein YgcG